MDIAEAIVTVVFGRWGDHPPYTDLALEIVDNPIAGVKSAFEEYERRKLKPR